MEVLIPEVQDLVTKFKESTFELTPEERDKIRIEKERIFRLNQKIYGRTKGLKMASAEQRAAHGRNKKLIKYLIKIINHQS